MIHTRHLNYFSKSLTSCLINIVPKKITKKEQKSLLKPWITRRIQKSIKKKNKTYKGFCKFTDPLKKNEFHIKFKPYINSVVKLTRQHKEEIIWNPTSNITKNLKRKLERRQEPYKHKKVQQIALNINNQTITDDFFIANRFNTSSHQ